MRVTNLRTAIVHVDFRKGVLVRIETGEGITGIPETVMKRRTRGDHAGTMICHVQPN